MAIQWTEMLNVNVAMLNNHHKTLIALINELDDAMLTGKTRGVMGKTLQSLCDYTKYHFGEEERLMLANSYYGYTSHKKKHDIFITKVGECIEKYEDGKITVSIELMNFLRDWLKTHIMGTDKRYSQFFNDRGVR